MRSLRSLFLVLLLIAPAWARHVERWTPEQANRWYAAQPWLVGSNYLPASAINQLEMWQADTFDPERIDREFGWAEGLGMNTMRVFLHDLVWQQDARGYKQRIDRFLAIADKHHIRPVFVFFDSCWDPRPVLGKQHPPVPGVHNSGWVQSPGADALDDPKQYNRLRKYVQGVIHAYAHDHRVLAWDLWNEPDNGNGSSYGGKEAKDKTDRVVKLLPQVFAWARSGEPDQPLTSGVWQGAWGKDEERSPTVIIQVEQSDVISFHNYESAEKFEARVESLRAYGRPLICTEYMARGQNSTFEGILPVAKKDKVAAINWGFVAGKSQTFYPWDSWKHPYTDRQPAVWFHDIFHEDGRPYRPEEVSFIRRITGAEAKMPAVALMRAPVRAVLLP